jgi:hypothetical protein
MKLVGLALVDSNEKADAASAVIGFNSAREH